MVLTIGPSNVNVHRAKERGRVTHILMASVLSTVLKSDTNDLKNATALFRAFLLPIASYPAIFFTIQDIHVVCTEATWAVSSRRRTESCAPRMTSAAASVLEREIVFASDLVMLSM